MDCGIGRMGSGRSLEMFCDALRGDYTSLESWMQEMERIRGLTRLDPVEECGRSGLVENLDALQEGSVGCRR